MSNDTWEFSVAKTSDEVQELINKGEGAYYIEFGWKQAVKWEKVEAGDGAILTVTDPADKSCWIATVDDVEWNGRGFPMTITLNIR